jgi:hypothetical protein
MRQWWNSDAFHLSIFILLSRLWDVIDHIFSFCNALGVCLVTQDLLPKTVIRQWWDSDATVIEQWCLWFELFNDIFKLLRCHWSYFTLLQCLGSVFGDTRPFDKNNYQNSDETVMEQWCNSDGTAMALIRASEMSLIIFYPYAMPWEFVWWHNTICQKQWSNSDETSDGTVMQQWLNSDAFDLSFLILISRF